MFLHPSALLRTKFAFWFPPFSTQNRTEDPSSSAWKIRAHPHVKSVSARAEDPRRSAQLSMGVHAEQPRNSSEKLSFPCHVPYMCMSVCSGIFLPCHICSVNSTVAISMHLEGVASYFITNRFTLALYCNCYIAPCDGYCPPMHCHNTY